MDFGDINEYFKRFKDDDCTALPDVETIIKEAYKVKITDERIEEIISQMPQPEVAVVSSPEPVVTIQQRAEVGGTDSVYEDSENRLIVDGLTSNRAIRNRH